METAKIGISLNTKVLKRLDRLVRMRRFASRSRAIQDAIEDHLNRIEKTRLAEECAKLNPAEEQALSEEGMTVESREWPEY